MKFLFVHFIIMFFIIGCKNKEQSSILPSAKPVVADFHIIDETISDFYNISLDKKNDTIIVHVENKTKQSIFAPSDLIFGGITSKPFVFVIVSDLKERKLYKCGRFELPVEKMKEVVIKPKAQVSFSVEIEQIKRAYCIDSFLLRAYVGSYRGKNYAIKSESDRIEVH